MASESNWAGTEPLPVHRRRICTLSMMLWTVFDSFPNTLTTQHAKYKWCAKRPAVCSQYTPHIDYNSVNKSQSGVHCSILIHGKLFSHFLLLLNTTLQYVKTYPTLCGQISFTFTLTLLRNFMISSRYFLQHSRRQAVWETQFINFFVPLLYRVAKQHDTCLVSFICMNICEAEIKVYVFQCVRVYG